MKLGTVENTRERTGSGALFLGGLAAILASTCCFGPLVLVAVGLSGAWIGNLTRLEPYRPFFIAAALVALFFAGQRNKRDRKSTRLNSSHQIISYAVFCLKKKKKINTMCHRWTIM